MHPYVTYCAGRREPWRGHDSKRAVRAAIRESGHRGLRVFARDHDREGPNAYWEVTQEVWSAVFAD